MHASDTERLAETILLLINAVVTVYVINLSCNAIKLVISIAMCACMFQSLCM